MSTPKAWRRTKRLADRIVGLLRVPDETVARPDGAVVLFSCHDVDRGMQDETGRFAPLLEGIRNVVRGLGHRDVNLTHPFATWRSAEVQGTAVTLNRRALRIRLRALCTAPWHGGYAAARHRLEAQMYARVLAFLAPRLVVSIQPPMALCEAARRSGIRVVEAMHGNNISPHDSFFRAHMQQPDLYLPNVVLSFDDVSHATVSALCRGRDIVALRAPHPWLRHCRRQLAAQRTPSTAAQSRRGVLLTLQWGYDGERETLSGIVPNGILHPAIEATIKAFAGQGVQFLVRMHPVQANSPGYRHHARYVEALAARLPHVEVRRASRDPLPILLDEVCCHLTMSSSSAGDAAMAGVPSLLLCPTLQAGGANHGLFRELEQAGLVTFSTLDSAAIERWIRDHLAQPVRAAAPRDALVEADESHFYAALLESGASAEASQASPVAGHDSMCWEGR